MLTFICLGFSMNGRELVTHICFFLALPCGSFSLWLWSKNTFVKKDLMWLISTLVLGLCLISLDYIALYPTTIPKPYDFTRKRREQFLQLAKPPIGNTTKIRVACISGNERGCVTAGQFLLLLSEAGWPIEENRVFQMNPSIPSVGVSLASRPDDPTLPSLPPHLGRWHRENTSELSLALGFMGLGIRPSGSSDPSLSENNVGVYFGVEPESLEDIPKINLIALREGVLEGEITEIEKHDRNLANESEWNSQASDWLQLNVGRSAKRQFDQKSEEKEKQAYFSQVASDFLKQKLPTR